MSATGWKKLFARLFRRPALRDPGAGEGVEEKEERRSAAEPAARRSATTGQRSQSATGRLRALLESLAEGQERGEQAEEVLALVDQLVAHQDTGAAARIMAPFGAQLHERPELALRLAAVLHARGRLAEAVDLWQQLASRDESARAAHLALAEHFRRQGDAQRALWHFEEVLARDFSCAEARRAADLLHDQLRPPSFAAAPTIIGGHEAGAQQRFAVERELGGGGGGRVYLALDRKLQRPVAVKVLHRRLARQTGLRARVFCEARIAASLQHPQIVAVYELDEALALVAMEYCAGGALSATLAAGNAPPTPTDALARLEHMCAVLEVVHRAGIVHGDIKPENWLLRHPLPCASPLVLTDFGSARVALEPGDTGVEQGTAAYATPEQLAGEKAGPPADLYACGLITFELLIGRRLAARPGSSLGEQVVADGDLWRELEARLPDDAAGDIVELLQRLLVRRDESRSLDAEQTRRRAYELRSRCERAAERALLVAEPERLAGPEPRSPELER